MIFDYILHITQNFTRTLQILVSDGTDSVDILSMFSLS